MPVTRLLAPQCGTDILRTALTYSVRELIRIYRSIRIVMDKKSKRHFVGDQTRRGDRKRKKSGPPNRYQVKREKPNRANFAKGAISMATKITAVLIDLSGTLHIDNTVIPGAVESLKRLRETRARIKFVTNTTKESKTVLHNRLTGLGFDIKKDEIFSSLAAARQLIINRKLNPLLLIDAAAMDDFEDLKRPDEDLNSVVVGLAPDKFCYDQLNRAFRLLIDGAALIAIHEGRYYKRPDGLALGPGAFIKGLEYSASVKAEVVGKPTKEFFMAALNDLDPQEAIMIGDDVRDDVAGSQAAGLRGILVKTGKYRVGDENTIAPPPYKVCESFVEAIDAIIDQIARIK